MLLTIVTAKTAFKRN